MFAVGVTLFEVLSGQKMSGEDPTSVRFASAEAAGLITAEPERLCSGLVSA